ncbi:hypothetical protein [Methylobacterium isbiliense]|jgi:hypothetical protein|uniref:Uncharacterized protein n=1 Tax=Methylobacterium isbiliense TaxID=315478 RepID=A0ABQ4SB16_9HYPH|nr:hypothetical protein [Methylobacterium isbiliense]MDN3625170.1 hypothetical protein [Methylobacterium isbiliense]GJE00416.1 hypothetical protein GMJLKIPL_2338 [Methylobacterium isbiliense]
MPRARQPFADAIRVARAIVALEGAALARAARARDPAAVEAAAQALACRIADALLEAEREAEARATADA